jgi:uncharacterized protein (DUF2062 family)
VTIFHATNKNKRIRSTIGQFDKTQGRAFAALGNDVQRTFIPFVTLHVIAVSMAIGMFFGLIPLCGLKTLPAIGITRLLPGSIVGAAIGVTLHDIILPVVPLLLGWEYEVGYWLLSHPHELPPRLCLSHQSPAIWCHWPTFSP